MQILPSKIRVVVARVGPLIWVAACAPQTVYDFADAHNMAYRTVRGDGFEHLAITRFGAAPDTDLHVYIEGDGVPWVGNLPSSDPTPRNTLALRLAGQDPGDVIYLGRPCYFGFAEEEPCFPEFWTSHRYGEKVLSSMAGAIGELRLPRHERIVLIGHSGGGAIASLLETRVEGVAGVITVAANLDTEKWARHHRYDGLAGSLNPIEQRRAADILHLQLVGTRDATVPPYTSREYADIHSNVELLEFEDFDHVCCWETAWPDLLQRFSERLATR